MLQGTESPTKTAAEPHHPTIGPEAAEYNQQVKADAIRQILRIGLLTSGVGVGAGLATKLLGRQSIKSPDADSPDIDLPYPQLKLGSYAPYYMGLVPAVSAASHAAAGAIRSDDKPAGAAYGGAIGLGRGLAAGGGAMAGSAGAGALASRLGGKSATVQISRVLGALLGFGAGDQAGGYAARPAVQAIAGSPPWKEKKADWADKVVEHTIPTSANEPSPGLLSKGWLRGDTSNSVAGMPWFLPAALGTGVAGLAGGRSLTRWILKKRRKADLDAEIEKAKKEYEDAMMSQYDPGKIHKLASEGHPIAISPADRLDKAVESFSKRAGQVNDALGTGVGGYLALAALLAGGTGMASYQHFSSLNKSKMLENALKNRAMIRGLSNPPDVYLHPVPAHLSPEGSVEEDEAVDPTKNIAV